MFTPSQPTVADGAREKLIGVWKLGSCIHENVDTMERRALYGARPKGYIIVTPERFMTIITGEGRKVPQTDEDQVASFQTMFAYSGPYTIDGNRLTTKVDIAWNETWTGTDQVRFFKIEGNKLSIETAPMAPIGLQTGMTKGILEWVRSK